MGETTVTFFQYFLSRSSKSLCSGVQYLHIHTDTLHQSRIHTHIHFSSYTYTPPSKHNRHTHTHKHTHSHTHTHTQSRHLAVAYNTYNGFRRLIHTGSNSSLIDHFNQINCVTLWGLTIV